MRVLIFLCTSFLFVQSTIAQVDLTNGLVAYLPFTGNANDASGNGHNGQLLNGVQSTTDRFGNPNSAFLFDGVDDFIRIPDNGAFSSPAFSLVLWFQTGSDALQNLLAKRDFTTTAGSGGAQYQFFINYPPFPGIGSNIVGNNSSCTDISISSYINTNDWICRNKWYCAVVTFNGEYHRIYIDGVLKKEEKTNFTAFLSCTSDIRLGNWYQADRLPFKGKLDEMRWYNRALNQQEVTALFGDFPVLTGTCTPSVNTSFLVPDTVCVNTPVTIANTSVGASNYFWNFCVTDLKTPPTGENLGNIGGNFSFPVFMDYVHVDGNYYGFLTNNVGGNLIRMDFGSSLLNTPTSVNLGNFGGAIPAGVGSEGIQLVLNEGKWYAIIVGGHPPSGSTPRVIKIEFGPNISNPAPVATNWGNIGNLYLPIDLHVFKEGGNWYGLTANAENNTITRFNFTKSFDNTPTAENLGNIGNLSYPTGIYAINDDGFWRVFIVNGGDNTRNNAPFSLTRLDFGTSLLNTPTGINLGNPGDFLKHPRDLTIMKQCGQIVGFAVNGHNTNSHLIRIDFGNSLTATPAFTSLGVMGNSSFPHSISKLFRVNEDVYGFVTNVDNNTITRLKFSGCTDASISSSTDQNPDPVLYKTPGVYNINLTVDEGLPTQNAYCRQVVVVESLKKPLQTKTICTGDSILLTSAAPAGNLWSTGSTDASINVKASGTYWVKSTNAGGCSNIDSFVVNVKSLPVVDLGPDVSICSNDRVTLDAGNPGAGFLWQDGQTGQQVTVSQNGLYHVAVTKDGCTTKDSVNITVMPLPVISITGNTTICKDGKTDLLASGGVAYSWTPATGLSHPSAAATVASPQTTTNYVVTVKGQNGCQKKDSVLITVTPKPVFTAVASKDVLCKGDSVVLTATGGDKYTWTPAASVSSPTGNTTYAFPQTSTLYKVVIEESRCNTKDSLFVNLSVADKPLVQTTKSNDINCFIGEATLSTGGGRTYLWQPATGLSDPASSRPVARISSTTTYHVFITTTDGCQVEDSITVFVTKGDDGSGFPVPNAFTPNGDGKNDCFGVKYWGEVQDFSMDIYNRWGERLFHANQPTSCWNGHYKGQPQPGDVYVYVIKAKTRCGDVFRKGSFTLIR